MKALRGFLIFLLGMVMGIILLVVAVGGAIYGIIANVTVGEIQDNYIKQEIVSPDSDLYGNTLLDALKKVIYDIRNTDNLSLQVLYDHYGITVLNGISGVDFTQKEFYTTPIFDIIANPSILLDSFTLNDVSIVANIDLTDYNLPILTDNLDNSISTAVDNILTSLSGSLTVRTVKDQIGIDIGVESNSMIKLLQDVPFTSFGDVVNTIYLNSIIEADTDVFVKKGLNNVFVQVDIYEEVSDQDLQNNNYIAPIGVETYICGATDMDNNGQKDTLQTRELRYVKKMTNDPVPVEYYAVDNSCYLENFDIEKNQKTFYRHIQYAPYGSVDGGRLFVPAYADKVENVYSASSYRLLSAGFQALDEVYTQKDGNLVSLQNLVTAPVIDIQNIFVLSEDGTVQSENYTILDTPPTKDSKLQIVEGGVDDIYLKAHIGTSAPILQAVAHLTVAELQNADGLFDNIKIGDIVEINDDTSKIIVALKDSTLKTIGTDVNDLTLEQMIDITMDDYVEAEFGHYVLVEDANGNASYTLYNPAIHGSNLTTYNKVENPNASSTLLQKFAKSTINNIEFDNLVLGDVIDIDIDIYKAVSSDYAQLHPEEVLYTFDNKNSVYKRWDGVREGQLFAIAKEGGNSAIIKRLAFAKVDTLADSMESVLDDIMLQELVDINLYSAVSFLDVNPTPSANDNSKYFLPAVGEEDGRPYTFVYDNNGKYMKRDYQLVATNEAQLAKSGVKYFKYIPLNTVNDCVIPISQGNIYYKNGNEFVQNIPLCIYLATTDFVPNELFTRVETTASDPDAVSANIITESDVYVEINGTYFAYDSNNLAHLNTTYLKKVNGACFVSITAKGLDESYAYTDSDAKLSKQYCDKVYVLDEDGSFVYIGGHYIPYDASVHEGNERYREEIGYIASQAQVYYSINNGAEYLSDLQGIVKVDCIREQSVSVLRLFAKENVTVNNVNEVIESATIADIMDVEPGSIFARLSHATLGNIDELVEQEISKLSLGDFIEMSSITDIDPQVVESLKDVSIDAFFRSLKFSNTKGIYVDLVIALGYERA